MPSVRMRRSTRVFGVGKRSDGARVLRSGRRLWLESPYGKIKKGGEKNEWYSFVDSKGSGKQIGWVKNANPKLEVPTPTTGDCKVNEVCDPKPVAEVVDGRTVVDDKMFGIVYSRRSRKRKALDVSNLDDKKYRIHFSRRMKRKKVEGKACVVDLRGLVADVKSAFCGEDSGFGEFLCSILRYMKKVRLEVSELSGFLLEDPMHAVYASRGVRFLWDPPSNSTVGSGICKLFQSRDDIPMFLVNFSAIPNCFRSIHIGILLKHPSMPSARVNNLNDEQIDSDDEDGEPLGVKTSSLPPNTKTVVGTPLGRLKSRHGVDTRGIRKRRSSLKSRRARYPPIIGRSKKNGALASDLVTAKKNGFPFSSIVSGRKVRRSGRRKPAQDINSIGTTTAARELVLSRDELTSCSANLLIVESDKCFREEGATVLLEPSELGEWCLVVKRDGLTRYTHKATEAMKPSSSNRFSHADVWTGDNSWRLEFSDRDEWFKFKDIYKECLDRNRVALSPTSAAAVKFIPVPGVREVPDYEDLNLSTFARPSSYITMGSGEVSRAMLRRTANYDMDCEDEEWLRRFNEETLIKDDEVREELKDERFELMIDAFEKDFYNNPHDFSNEKLDANLCVDMGRREVVEAVYGYWIKKRKHKRLALIKALQVNQTRKAPLVPKPALRKKRSFKRQASHHRRGKQTSLLQALVVAEREASIEDQKSLQKLEEARANANRSLEVAVSKRRRAQFLMGNADLAAYRATMALRIAVAAEEAAESPDGVAAHFLD